MKYLKDHKLVFIIILCIIFFSAGFFWLLVQLPSEVIARGVSVGPLEVGGLTRNQVWQILKNQTETIENRGFDFIYKNVSANLGSVSNSSFNPELSKNIFDYNLEKTIEEAFLIGRQGSWAGKLLERFSVRLFNKKIYPAYNLDQKAVEQFLKQNFSSFEEPVVNAHFEIFSKENKEWGTQIIKENSGKIFDYQAAEQELADHLKNLNSSSLPLHLQEDLPKIFYEETLSLKPLFEELLKRGNLELSYLEKHFSVGVPEWSVWVEVAKDRNGRVVLDLNRKAKELLETKIAPQIDLPVQEAKFVMKDNKVAEFQSGKSGEKLNLDKTLEAIKTAFFANGVMTIDLKIEKEDPLTTVEEANELGIRELVGIGTTNFQGSPANRRHNIKIAAAFLNGLLILPAEEFSLIKKLSPIDATSGYLPELVIKGNKTKPEYGGGLCQISTTMFRVVLNTGLPILERANHAYRVPYYEPPVGMDATIYDPKPDFRFLNDTGNYLLLQTKIQGNNLIFELWGTKDGRMVSTTVPKRFNYVSPPESKLIETLDLPIGQKKCTERAHAGLDTVFTYIVSYPNGGNKTQDFKSHFRPWGEVCLIGVEKLSEPILMDGAMDTASSTNENSVP